MGPKWRPAAESQIVCSQVLYIIEDFVSHELEDL